MGSNYYKEVISAGVLHPGEMGVAVAATLQSSGLQVWWASEGRSEETRRRAAAAGLRDAGTVANLCRECGVIVGVCPPEFAHSVANEVARLGYQGLYIDANAISPEHARRIGRSMAASGIRFVDGCIIGLPPRASGETWMYLSGEHASEAAALFHAGPLRIEVLSGDIGKASALKMVFAAHTKGLAALRAAILGAADQLGVLPELERQWARSGPPMEQVSASIQHVAPKAWRFVAEMREIAETFESAGMPSGFHRAAAEIFARLAPFRGAAPVELDQVLEKLTHPASDRAPASSR